MPSSDTMDQSPDTSPPTQLLQQSPVPLALSEYIARAAPCSDTTVSDKPVVDIKEQYVVAQEPEKATIQDQPGSSSPNPQPDEKSPPPLPNVDTEPPPPPADWLAIRQQLLPRKNQGKKADWIRGWSHAVSMHGDSAYCACSETLEHAYRVGRKSRSSDIAGNMRSIFQRAASPSSSNKNSRPAPELEICPNCSRPSSPPPSPSAIVSFGSDKAYSFSARSITKRFSDLMVRVRSLRPEKPIFPRKPRRRRGRRRGSGDGNDDDDDDDDEGLHTATWPPEGDYQPPWAVAVNQTRPQKRSFIPPRPSSQPVSAAPPKSSSRGGGASEYIAVLRNSLSRGRLSVHGGVAGGATNGDKVLRNGAARQASSSTSEMSDSDARNPHTGLAKSLSRLGRAAALLQRTTSATRPKS
jgi:hypothetical protein